MKPQQWKKVLVNRGDADKYFDYYVYQDGKETYYERHAKPGYEHLERDHRPIGELCISNS